jgi:hypothetical protein
MLQNYCQTVNSVGETEGHEGIWSDGLRKFSQVYVPVVNISMLRLLDLTIELSIYPSIHPSIYCSIAFCWALPAFSVSWSFTQSVELFGGGINLSQRPLPAHRRAQTQNKNIQTCMLHGEFEPMIPMFERAKTVHAFDRAATVIGCSWHQQLHIKEQLLREGGLIS